jgi:hypothetical protein
MSWWDFLTLCCSLLPLERDEAAQQATARPKIHDLMTLAAGERSARGMKGQRTWQGPSRHLIRSRRDHRPSRRDRSRASENARERCDTPWPPGAPTQQT